MIISHNNKNFHIMYLAIGLFSPSITYSHMWGWAKVDTGKLGREMVWQVWKCRGPLLTRYFSSKSRELLICNLWNCCHCPGCASELPDPELAPLAFKPEQTTTLPGMQDQHEFLSCIQTPIQTLLTPRKLCSFFYNLKNHYAVQIRYMTDERKWN